MRPRDRSRKKRYPLRAKRLQGWLDREAKKLKTTLHTYDYDLTNPEHSGPVGEYTNLEIKLRHTLGRGHCMEAIPTMGGHNPEPGPVELDPEFLYQNQWNSNKGRVFDWWLEVVPGRPWIKRGHYLDITPEMIAIRQKTLKCGYTGAQFPDTTKPRFNVTQNALGSPYLKEDELHLVRLLPVCEEWTTTRQPLTPEERDFLLPLYIEAQTKTESKARDKQREEVLKEYKKITETALIERDGYLWLLDHGIQTENCIFYDHTGRFNFGWRNKFTGAAREKLLELLAKFPFPYDVA